MTLSVHEIRNCIYKRLETDAEFRLRARQKSKIVLDIYTLNNSCGEELDDYVWSKSKMQRRIIEVFPGETK